jgi:protein involved in temperature-dependent protein secretion
MKWEPYALRCGLRDEVVHGSRVEEGNEGCATVRDVDLHCVAEVDDDDGVEGEVGNLLGGARLGWLRHVLHVLHTAIQQEEALADLVMTPAELLITIVAEVKAATFLLLGLGEAPDQPALHSDRGWGSRGGRGLRW